MKPFSCKDCIFSFEPVQGWPYRLCLLRHIDGATFVPCGGGCVCDWFIHWGWGEDILDKLCNSEEGRG